MATPEQERVFLGALRAAAAIRNTAREQALSSFPPSDPANFIAFTTAIQAADDVFRSSVTSAAVVADVVIPLPVSSAG
jgi:hypothetical protein